MALTKYYEMVEPIKYNVQDTIKNFLCYLEKLLFCLFKLFNVAMERW